jgi:hypothetical protein
LLDSERFTVTNRKKKHFAFKEAALLGDSESMVKLVNAMKMVVELKETFPQRLNAMKVLQLPEAAMRFSCLVSFILRHCCSAKYLQSTRILSARHRFE